MGGTVGDIESLPFMEAIRQLSLEVGYHNHIIMHVTLVPYILASEELKNKANATFSNEIERDRINSRYDTM